MRYAKHFSSLLVVAASLLFLSACGQKSNCSGITFGGGSGGSGGGGINTGGSVCGSGNNNNGGARDYLFFQQQGNLLNTAAFNGTAFVTTTGGLIPSLGAGAGADMVVVNKKFLYLTWIPQGGTGQVLGFAINGGSLTPLTGSPFDAMTSKVDTIVADPGGRFLIVGNSASGDLSVFTISSTGALTLTPASPLTSTNFVPTQLVLDGTGSYLYATEVTHTGDVFGFTIDQNTFDLTEMAGSPFFMGVTKVAGEPSGQYLLGVDGSASVNVITIESGTGALISITNFPSTHAGDSILVHPTGKFVYTYSIGNPLEGFSFSGGSLSPLAGSPFTSLPILHPCKLDQSGTTLFGYTILGGFGARLVDTSTGAVTGGTISDLSVTSSPNFAATN